MKLVPILFPCGADTLSGLLYLPERTRRSTHLLMAHGFTAGKYSMDGLAGYLADRGYPTMTFDFVGHKLGASGGEMRHASQAVDNVIAALDWLRTHEDPEHVVLIGHSMGGIAVLNAAAHNGHPRLRGGVTGVVSLCAGVQPSLGFGSAIGKAMLAQRADYVTGGPAAWILEELDSLTEAAGHISHLPSLFVAARQDVVVSPSRVVALAGLAGPAASVTVLETTHLEAPDRSRGAILQWLEGIETTQSNTSRSEL